MPAMSQLAVSTQLFGAQELSRRHLEMIRAAGFRAVEVFAAPGHFAWADEAAVAEVAGWLRELQLGAASLHAPWAPGQDTAAIDPLRRERSLRAVEQAVDALVILGGSILVLHPGAAPAGAAESEEQLRLAEASIAHVAHYAAARGVRVALENPPPYELGGDNTVLLQLYRHLAGEPAVQACFDTGHAHLSPEGVAFAGSAPKELLLVHVSDNAGQADDHLPPGEGSIAWPDLFAALRERRFCGYLVLELTDLPHPERILVAGRRWLQEALKEIQ
jgi:sugar phosphate isomerase/epimerase